MSFRDFRTPYNETPINSKGTLMTETTVSTTTPSTEPVEDDSPVVTVNWSKLGRIAKKSARYALPAAAGFAALCLVKALASSDDDTEETDSTSSDDVVDAELVDDSDD